MDKAFGLAGDCVVRGFVTRPKLVPRRVVLGAGVDVVAEARVLRGRGILRVIGAGFEDVANLCRRLSALSTRWSAIAGRVEGRV